MSRSKQPSESRDPYAVVADAINVWKRPVRYQTVVDAVEVYKRIALLYIVARADGNTPCADMLERWNDEVYDGLPEYARQEVSAWVAALVS